MRTQSICLTLAIVLLCPYASAQWVQANGPCGGYILCLASAGANLFAGTQEGGLFVSTDNGTSWRQSGLTDLSVYAIVVSGTSLFAGTGGGGVFRSIDNGTSWTEASTGLTNTSVYALAVSGTSLFAGTNGDGIFISTNNGTSWTQTSLASDGVFALAVSGTNLLAGTSESGVFLSTDGGTSWAPTLQTWWGGGVSTLAVNGTNLFAGNLTRVFYSSNNGISWKAASSLLTATVTALAVSGTNLFAGTERGVFLSTDGGTIWTAVTSGLTNLKVWSLANSGTSILAGTGGGGVFRSTDNGTNWSAASIGLTNASVQVLAESGGNLFAGTGGSGISRSTDNGTNWTAVNAGLTNHDVLALAVSGTNLFAGTSGGVFVSTDKGIGWKAVNEGLPRGADDITQYVRIHCLAFSMGNLFAGVGSYFEGNIHRDGAYRSGGLFRSTDNGGTWTSVNNGLVNFGVTSLAVCGGNLIAGSDGVFVSTDNGTNWISSSEVTGSVTCFAVNGTNVFAGFAWGRRADSYCSTDGGKTWSGRGKNICANCLAVSGAYLFAGVDAGVLLSADSEASWRAVNNGLPKDPAFLTVPSLAICGTNLFVCTSHRGVWRRPLSEMIVTSVSNTEDNLPSTYSLAQNYPNPFNPSTTIRFELPKSSMVTLSVFDILGREVSVLADENRNAGVHEVKFDGSSTASGVYFYRLQAGDFVSIKKLLIVK